MRIAEITIRVREQWGDHLSVDFYVVDTKGTQHEAHKMVERDHLVSEFDWLIERGVRELKDAIQKDDKGRWIQDVPKEGR